MKKKALTIFIVVIMTFLLLWLSFAYLRSRQSENLANAILEGNLHSVNGILNNPIKRSIININRFTHKNRIDGTPLQWASMNGKEDIAIFLVNSGVDVNRRGFIDSPLIMALMNDMGGLAETLLDHGADVTLKGRQEITALHIAVRGGAVISADEIIARGGDVNAKTAFGHTPLHFAASSGNIKAVQTLINNGAKANVSDLSGVTPLHLSVGNEDIINLLLDANADTDAQGDILQSTIDFVFRYKGRSMEGFWTYTYTFFRSLNSLKIKGRFNWTPLHYACALGHLPSVSTLLNRGASLDIKDAAGRTALDCAKKEIVEYIEHFTKTKPDND